MRLNSGEGIFVQLLYFIFVCSCGGDGSVGNDAFTYLDAGSVDVGFAADSTCEEDDIGVLGYEISALHQIRLLQSPVLNEGQSIRFAAGLAPSDCEQFAGVFMLIHPSLMQIELQAVVYNNAVTHCEPVSSYEEDYLVASNLPAGIWTIIDAVENSAATSIPFEVLPCDADCWCTAQLPPVGLGGFCSYDCECDQGLTCIAYFDDALNSEVRGCYQSCEGWYDCELGHFCDSVDGGPSGVCVQYVVDECYFDHDCPDDYVCIDSSCYLSISSSVAGSECDCDGQCGDLKCVALSNQSAKSCHFLCRGVRDCPSGPFEGSCIFVIGPGYRLCGTAE